MKNKDKRPWEVVVIVGPDDKKEIKELGKESRETYGQPVVVTELGQEKKKPRGPERAED